MRSKALQDRSEIQLLGRVSLAFPGSLRDCHAATRVTADPAPKLYEIAIAQWLL